MRDICSLCDGVVNSSLRFQSIALECGVRRNQDVILRAPKESALETRAICFTCACVHGCKPLMKIQFECSCGGNVSGTTRGTSDEVTTQMQCDECGQVHAITITPIGGPNTSH